MHFQISAELFWGFSVDLNPLAFKNTVQLVEFVKQSLMEKLWALNLQVLAEKLRDTEFHCDLEFDKLVEMDPDMTIYICDHHH